MSFAALLTHHTAHDLEELYDCVARHDAPGKAEHVLGRLEKALGSLSESPQRGAHRRELLVMGIRYYREVFFKPHRIIYKVTGTNVHVLLIADGRRDLQTLLRRRLLEECKRSRNCLDDFPEQGGVGVARRRGLRRADRREHDGVPQRQDPAA